MYIYIGFVVSFVSKKYVATVLIKSSQLFGSILLISFEILFNKTRIVSEKDGRWYLFFYTVPTLYRGSKKNCAKIVRNQQNVQQNKIS